MTAQNTTKVLLVEDGRFYRSVLKVQLEKELGFEVLCAENYAQACEQIEQHGADLFLALLDLSLPDASNGEIVDFVSARKIPSLIFSGQFDEELRDQLLQRNIIDYVVKESPASIEYVIATVKRLYKNQFVKVLMVDDSKTARYQMGSLLTRYKFQVLQATNGVEALRALDEHPDVRLVITDFNMPEMDGFELTKKIRTHHSKRKLPIIGVSTYGNHALSAKFIKVGANDFITKPFLNEEFFCRVSQNVDMVEYIDALQDSLITDYLTGLRNRRYLFERGQVMHKEAEENGGTYLVACMVDIDHFKRINDTYGHDAGDAVIREVADEIRQAFAHKGITARFGGEEFCVLMCVAETEGLFEQFDQLRIDIATKGVDYGTRHIPVTASFGISWQGGETVDAVINQADQNLYKAKKEGRNKVVSD